MGYSLFINNKMLANKHKALNPTGFSTCSVSYAYETLIEVVETVGIQKVAALGLKHVGLDFIGKTRDDFYNQHELAGDYLILTHSSTDKKKRQLEEISEKLGLGLKVEVV